MLAPRPSTAQDGVRRTLTAIVRPGPEVDIAHAQFDELGCSEAVPVGEEDHRVVPGGVAFALLGGAQERTHLVLGEVVAQAPVRCHIRNVPERLRSSTPVDGGAK